MIDYTLEEIETDRLEALEEKLLTDASMEWNNKNPNHDESREDEDKFVSNYLEDNRERITTEFLREVQSGSYHCHEAIENASRTMDRVHELLEQSSIVARPEWFAMAHKASTLIFNLYQEIGAEHISAIPENTLEMIEEQKRRNLKEAENEKAI